MFIKTKTKILHVLTSSESLPYLLDSHVCNYDQNQYELFLACGGGERFNNFVSKYSIKPISIPLLRKFNIFLFIISLYILIKFIRRNEISVVIGHTPVGSLLSMLASFFSKVPNRIYVRHGLIYETKTGLVKCICLYIEKLTSYLANTIINVSTSLVARSKLDGLNPSDKNVLLKCGSFCGIDISRFNRNSIDQKKIEFFRKKYNILDDSFVCGYVGRLCNDKGINELIRAWKIFKNKNAQLILVGPIDSRDGISIQLQKEIEDDNTILYIGEVTDVEAIMALFNVFILPSYREGLPTVNLEASMLEIPVITSSSTGCIDSIIPNRTGIFCKITAKDIEEKIFFYYKNQRLRELHGRNGRMFVNMNFDSLLVWKEFENKILNNLK